MYKKCLIPFLILALTAVPVAADDAVDTAADTAVAGTQDMSEVTGTDELTGTEDYASQSTGLDWTQLAGMSDVFTTMATASELGQLSTMSSALSSVYGVDIYDSALFDLSSNVSDIGGLNLTYAAAMMNLTNNFQSAYVTSGAATDCYTLFENTYGSDLMNLSLETPSLPEGWDASTLLSQQSSAITSAYASSISSDSFQSVKNSISTSSIFSAAAAGPSTSSLASASSLSSLLSGYSSSGLSAALSSYNGNKTSLENSVESASEIEQKSQINFMSMYGDSLTDSLVAPYGNSDMSSVLHTYISSDSADANIQKRLQALSGASSAASESTYGGIGDSLRDLDDGSSSESVETNSDGLTESQQRINEIMGSDAYAQEYAPTDKMAQEWLRDYGYDE